MGLFGAGKIAGNIIDKGVSIIDQAVIDKDKAYELKMDFMKTVAINMLTGKGASVTKITICGLVIVVVLTGTYTFLFNPGNIANFKDYALFSGTLIGSLIGTYAGATTVQTFARNRNEK